MFDCMPFENHFPSLSSIHSLHLWSLRSGCLFLQGRNQEDQSVVCQRRKLLLLVLLLLLCLLFRCILPKIKVVYFTALFTYNFNTCFAGKEAPANLNCQIAASLPPCQGTFDLQSAGKTVCLTFDVEPHPLPLCICTIHFLFFNGNILVVHFFPSGFCWI